MQLESEPDAADVRDLFAGERRIHVVDGDLDMNSGWDLQEFALDRGRDRMNLYENQIFGDSIQMADDQLYLFQSIHRESDVIPESIDAVRAITGSAGREESVARTNEALGVGEVWSRGASRLPRPTPPTARSSVRGWVPAPVPASGASDGSAAARRWVASTTATSS